MVATKGLDEHLYKFALEDIPLKKINKCVQKTVSLAKNCIQTFGTLPPSLKTALKKVRVFRVIEISDVFHGLVQIPKTKRGLELPLEFFLIVGEIYFLALDIFGGVEALIFQNFIPGWTDTVAALLAVGDVILLVRGWIDYSSHKAQLVLIPYFETEEEKAKFLAQFREKTFDAVSKSFSGAGAVFLAVSFFVPAAPAVFTLGCVAKGIGGGLALIKLFL
jgi:hypothetical protein